jgi:solute carrier family 9B (sodium/hydrogen exchanger), member 1/2
VKKKIEMFLKKKRLKIEILYFIAVAIMLTIGVLTRNETGGVWKIVLSFGILYTGGQLCGIALKKIHLPPLIGMIAFGCIANVYLKVIDYQAIEIGKYMKSIALVVVLLIGGLGIKLNQIKKVGRAAVMFSVIPAFMEGMAIAFISTKVFGLSFIQGGILGFIIAAVSPAVLVPAMVELISKRLGEKKAIPQMLLTGASADDSIAIALFTSFLSFYFGKGEIFVNIAKIPIAIFTGIAVGVIAGILCGKAAKKDKKQHNKYKCYCNKCSFNENDRRAFSS